MKRRALAILTAAALATCSAALAAKGEPVNINPSVDAAEVKKKNQSDLGLYVTAKEAYDIVSKHGDDVLFIDVRTRPELEYVGWTPLIDKNIPYVVNDFYVWDQKKPRFAKNPNSNFTVAFEEAVKAKGLNKDSTILMMCRSGNRSAKAASLVAKLGYKNVYSVVDGFEGGKAKSGPEKGHRVVNGWKNSDLPWGYTLEKAKMYWEE